jgi:uncharacterized protein (TIRG00374 family)
MLRRLLAALLALAFVILLIVRRDELARIRDALAGARLADLLLAATLQVAAWALFALLYSRALTAAGARCGWRPACAILMAALSVNLVVPSAGLAGAALWIDTLGRRGREPARVAAGVWLAWAADFAGLLLLATAALARALASGAAGALEWTGAFALFVALALMIAALAAATRRPDRMERVLTSARSIVNGVPRSVGRAPVLSPDWPQRVSMGIAEAVRPLLARPSRIAGLPAITLAAHAASAAALDRVAVAFGYATSAGAIVSTYTLAQVVWSLSPAPQGIGAVEGAIAAAFIARGAPVGAAASIALVYRGLTFWVPMLAGAIFLWRIRSLGSKTKHGEPATRADA